MGGYQLGVDWALAWIAEADRRVQEGKEELSELDRRIGDGDHGENLARGFAAVQGRLAAHPPMQTVGEVLKVVAGTLMSTVGGVAGPLYGTAFLRAAKACATPTIDAAGAVALLEAALDGIVARGKATVGEKTMVDAWAAAVAAARAAAAGGADAVGVLAAAATAAQDGSGATIPLQATKGRASYLGERSIGHRDPGAESTAIILHAAAASAARAAA